jgi:hypothetical protein
VEIILSKDPRENTLITFDGNVVEFFSASSRSSTRFHVAHIASFGITTNPQGKNFLSAASKYSGTILLADVGIRDEALAAARGLVGAVQRGMAEYPS